MAKSGRWKKSALRRQIVLEITNAKAWSDRSAISLAVPSRRAPLSPLAPVPLCVTPTKPVEVKGGKRKGAKATKTIERLLSKDHVLEPEEATAFRSLSARGILLAADRPDIGYSAKELCRQFAQPNQISFMKLKRMAKYLNSHKRLVYKYAWGDQRPCTPPRMKS